MKADVCTNKPTTNWFIYLVRTNAGALYAGISTDPDRRLRQHQSGKGARALRGKGPLTLVWRQEVEDKGQALRLEYRLKQQSKAFKEQLVQTPTLWDEWSQPWLTSFSKPESVSPAP